MIRALVVALVLCLLPWTATAGETFVIGGSIRPEVQSRGGWDDNDGIAGTKKVEKTAGYWLPGDPEFTDGVVKATLTKTRKLELGLLLRASVDQDGEVSGYQLHFKERTVRLERLDDGEVVPLTAYESVRGLKKIDSIDVYVLLVGDRIIVQIHGGENEIERSSLSVVDGRYKKGNLGLYREQRVRPRGRVTQLSLSDACDKLPAVVATNPRFVTLSRTVFANVEGIISPLDALDTEGGKIVARTDTAGIQALLCSNTEIEKFTVFTPLKYLDEQFLAAKKDGVQATDTGFVIDRSYKDPEMVEALLRAYQERFPDRTRLVELGRSHKDRPIWALVVSKDIDEAGHKPAFMLAGAHHGNEPFSVEVVLDAVQFILENNDDPRVSAWLDNTVVWFVPLVNPDGLHSHIHEAIKIGRKNGRETLDDGFHDQRDGIDLNRNYPFKWGELPEDAGSSAELDNGWYRGESAGSEPETQAMMGLGDREHFVASLSYHTGTVKFLAPYAIDGTINPEPNVPWLVAEEISLSMGKHPEGKTFEMTNQLYSVDGIEKDWHRWAHGTTALLVEAARWSPLEALARRETLDVVSVSWKMLLDRVVDGPSLGVHVIDKDGNPVVAGISIDQIKTFEGETWSTRCRDGRFDQLVPSTGTYTLRIAVDGHKTIKERVKVGKGSNHALIKLDISVGPADCEPHPLWSDVDVQSIPDKGANVDSPIPGHVALQIPSPHLRSDAAAMAPAARDKPTALTDTPETDTRTGGCGCELSARPPEPNPLAVVWMVPWLMAAVIWWA